MLSRVCDESYDCRDESDEALCEPYGCPNAMWKCHDRKYSWDVSHMGVLMPCGNAMIVSTVLMPCGNVMIVSSGM